MVAKYVPYLDGQRRASPCSVIGTRLATLTGAFASKRSFDQMMLPSPDESPIPLQPPSKPGLPPRRENVPPQPGSVPDEPMAPPVQPPQYDPPEQPVPPAWDSPEPETISVSILFAI
jgi:hypothetical protein